MSNVIKIGVVGYSDDKCFNHEHAKTLLNISLDIVRKIHPADGYELVSGLTNTGVPKLAYELADKLGWTTIGITAKEAKQFECYPVNKEIIVGENFGDESETFIKYIDILVRVGGGKQSMKETDMAKEKHIIVYEFDLPRLK